MCGCAEVVDVHTEQYTLDKNSFIFNGKYYNLEEQRQIFGENVYVGLISETRYGPQNTSSKGPYKIHIKIRDTSFSEAYVDGVRIYEFTSGELIYSETSEQELVAHKDPSFRQASLEKRLYDKKDSIVVQVNIKLGKNGSFKEEMFFYRFNLYISDSKVTIPPFTV